MARSTVVGQNPCTATLQYIVATNQSWTGAITGNYYISFTGATPAVSATNNAHYNSATAKFNAGGYSYVANMVKNTQSFGAADVAGVLTLGNGPGQPAYDAFSAGTNRRGIAFLFGNFLFNQNGTNALTAARDPSFAMGLPLSVIRLDVFRLASDSTAFTTQCSTCHGGIDERLERSTPSTSTRRSAMTAQNITSSENKGVAQKLQGRECLNNQYNAAASPAVATTGISANNSNGFCKTSIDTTTPGFRDTTNSPDKGGY